MLIKYFVISRTQWLQKNMTSFSMQICMHRYLTKKKKAWSYSTNDKTKYRIKSSIWKWQTMRRLTFLTKYFKMPRGILHQLTYWKIRSSNRFKKGKLLLITRISKVLQNILRQRQEIKLGTSLVILYLHILVTMISSLMYQLHRMVYQK